MKYQAIRQTWRDMKKRCDYTAHPAYNNYGGKGITYQTTWTEFHNFWSDMQESWFPDATIDRKESDKGYTKENCHWIAKRDQTRTGRLSKRKDNTSGITGIENFRGGFRVLVKIEGKKVTLYRGYDFFEAVCVRKAWEAEQTENPSYPGRRILM